MLKKKMDHTDRDIADYISVGIKEELLKKQKLKYKDKKNYYMIFVRELKESKISEVDNDYHDEDRTNFGHSTSYGHKIELEATTISYSTLWSAAQVMLDGFKKAFLHKEEADLKDSEYYAKEGLIIYYKNISDIDFADYELNGFTAYSADDDFLARFNKRNLDKVVKQYEKLLDNLHRQTECVEQLQEEIEEFKKGLSEEELLAISLVD